jgi:LacI family transcriptional regulator, gluconate utilization system Gnt-I transcriptional repressor
MLSWRPAAIAIVGSNHHPKAAALLTHSDVPVVEFWDSSVDIIDTMIGMDHRKIGRNQCRHLIDGGCSRLAFVGSVRAHDYRAQKRQAGAQEFARRSLGRKIASEISSEPGNPSLGGRLTNALLSRDPAIDGIVCNSDVIALGVLNSLRISGRRVPEDIAVIGFGDNDAGPCATPALTTIRPPRAEIGRLVAQAILSRIEGGPSTRSCLEAELVIRDSTRPAVHRRKTIR